MSNELVLIALFLAVLVGVVFFFVDDAQKTNPDKSKKITSSNDNLISEEDKLDRIFNVLNHIRWILAGGFLFIILVISGIIKPGIFSF